MRFSEADRQIVSRLVHDPSCKPSFEILKSCLVWSDERPTDISNEGYDLLCDIWIVRGFLHRRVPLEKWGLDPFYFQEVWKHALIDVPEWPGFKRLELSDEDRAYLSRCLQEAARGDDY